MSGIGNTAFGGTIDNGLTSGFFNHGSTDVFGSTPSGFNSGFANLGTGLTGLFSLTNLLS